MELPNQMDGVRLFLRGWLVMVLMTWSVIGQSQQKKMIGAPKWSAPFVIVIAESGNTALSNALLMEYQDTRGTSFLWLETNSTANPDTLVDVINQTLNHQSGIDLQHVYLLLSGGTSFLEKYYFLTASKFFSSHHTYGANVVVTTEDLRKVVHAFSQKYLWGIRLSQIKANNVSDLRQNAVRSGLTFGTNIHIPFYAGLEATIKPVFNSYSLGLYHQWSPRWQSLIHVSASLNIPSRSKIQREMSAAIFGEEDEVKIDVLAHVWVAVNLETRYLLPEWNKKLRPYVGFQVGYSSFRVAENNIEVDPSDILSGSLSRPEGFDTIEFEEFSGLNTGLGTGLYYQPNAKWKADFGLKWTQDARIETYLNHLSFSVGVQFRFAKRKELFYNYVSRREP